MLAAQLLVIALSMELDLRDHIQFWLWDLDREHNIPSTLASTQLALVGFVALLTAWLNKARSPWHNVYSAGLGILFIQLAREEFFHFRESDWLVPYALLGLVVVAATALIAVRSPQRLRIWHLCILAGLATGAAGAFVIEWMQFNGTCASLISYTDFCQLHTIEEILEFLGMWLVLIGVLGLFSDAAPKLSRRWQFIYLLPALWIGAHHYLDLIALAQFSSITSPSSLHYEDDSLELRIYRLDHDRNSASLQFFVLPRTWHHYTDIGYSLHLVDQVSGESIAGADVAGIPYLYKQRLELDIPLPPTNRALWLVLTTWRKQGVEFAPQKIESSAFPLLGDGQVILGELVFPKQAEQSGSSPIARFDKGLSLVSADIPDRVQAGQLLPTRFAWRSDRAITDDYTQFLHFGHEASGDWWVYDQQSLGARLPTRLWYSGMADSEIWQVPLPADLTPGLYTLFTGLYRSGDRERLPASATNGRLFVDARVPLGSLTIGVSD